MKLYKKYNYTIKTVNIKFKNLYSMIASYVPEDKIQEDIIIAGYLHSSLIYEKKDNDDVNVNKEGNENE